MLKTSFAADTWWVCWRELKHFSREKIRILMILIQPLIWLTLMGNLFQRIASVPGFPSESYLDYMAPGIVVMVTLFGGIYGGMSIVWDRRLGFLYKLLAAPISRSSVVAGKLLAIVVQTGGQALVIFAIALALGVDFKGGVLGVGGVLLLASLLSSVFAGISLSLGAVLTSHQTLIAVVNFLTMPMMFTSSAMMPLEFMPSWLRAVASYNPLTYAVGPMRTLFLSGWDLGAVAGGVAVLATCGLAAFALASVLFRRSIA